MQGIHPNGTPGPTEPHQIQAEERRWEALELRKRGLSFREIAKRMGIHFTTAHQHVNHALDELRERTKQSAEQLRTIEIEKLDRLEADLSTRLEGCTDDQDGAKLAAVMIKITESRRKLLGLDAPQKMEVSGNLYTVKNASPECDEWGQPATASPEGGTTGEETGP